MEDADEAVLFVHGNPGSSHDWDGLADAVGEFGSALAIDMPGFGQADKPRDFEYNVGGYANFIQGAVEPYRHRGESRFRIKGPDVRLLPRMALALAMALHELATNAAKYGSLSVPEGGVGIRWSVAPG